MSFGEILSRGMTAANRSVTGLLMYFLLYGIYQGLALVVGGQMTPEQFDVQPGRPPEPEFGLMMIYGCGSCVWMLVMLFSGPWVSGGVAAQLRDRMRESDEPTSIFIDYASRYYGRMLVLTLVYVGILIAVYILYVLVQAAIATTFLDVDLMQPLEWQEVSTHPANLAMGVVFVLVLTGIGVVFGLANAAVVVEEFDAFTSLGRGWSFVRDNPGDAGRLWLVAAGLSVLMAMLYWIPPLLDIRSMPVLAVLGTVIAVYFPYMLMLNLSLAVSLWLARRTAPGEEEAE